MKRLKDLKPEETEVAISYGELVQQHEPRTAMIGFTHTNACVVCDEVWPCDVAIVLAGFREFRQEAKRMGDTLVWLTTVAEAAAEVIKGFNIEYMRTTDRLKLIDRLAHALEQVQNLRRE